MRTVIIGGSPLSLEIAKKMKLWEMKKVTLVIEDKDQAMLISTQERDMTVVNGSPVDPDLLNQLELEHCDVFISATTREETSILAALYAKKYGVPRIFVKVNTHDTKAILEQLEMIPIDTDDAAAHNVVLEVAEPLIANLVGIGKGQFDIREKKAADYPNLWGKRLGDIEGKLFNVVAIFQDEKFLLSGDSIVNEDDSLIIFEEAGKDEDVTKSLKKLR